MDRHHPNDLTTDQEIDAAIADAVHYASDPTICDARFDRRQQMLFLELSDGRRLFIPREELTELHQATDDQAENLFIALHPNMIWWPQLDDGIYLPDFLERRWHKPVSFPAQIAA